MKPEDVTQFLDRISNDEVFIDGNERGEIENKLIAVARAALKFRYERFGTQEKRCYTEQAKRELDNAFRELVK